MKTIQTTYCKRFDNRVTETFSMCCWYRFHWSWFPL